MADPERSKLILLGLAAWTELESAVGRLVAATMRDDAEAAEKARSEAHDLLDHHLDLKIQGIGAIRRDLEKRSREL